MDSHSNAISDVKANPFLVVTGYFFAVLGGFIGLIIGASLRNAKTQLPTGAKVFKYNVTTRKHGGVIMAISIMMMVVGMFLRIAMG
jgi:hypothetical protein